MSTEDTVALVASVKGAPKTKDTSAKSEKKKRASLEAIAKGIVKRIQERIKASKGEPSLGAGRAKAQNNFPRSFSRSFYTWRSRSLCSQEHNNRRQQITARQSVVLLSNEKTLTRVACHFVRNRPRYIRRNRTVTWEFFFWWTF
jgi:hypothetical protein